MDALGKVALVTLAVSAALLACLNDAPLFLLMPVVYGLYLNEVA